MVQGKAYMDELGVHVEACSNEASAAAMLGASIHYPLRGAVTWKSIVGPKVAADALSNLSSPGVTGGVLIVVGEDYGEGASVIQERTHAYALKSSMHEKLKGEARIPAARRYPRRARPQRADARAGGPADLGIVVQGGLYNALIRSLQQHGLADAFGETDIPILVLNVTYPLVPEQVADFCVGKRAVLVVEEGQPEYIEQGIATLLRRRDIQTPAARQGHAALRGRVRRGGAPGGIGAFAAKYIEADEASSSAQAWLAGNRERREAVARRLSSPLPNRPPSFCVGCPERPVFSALKLAQQEPGRGARGRRHRLPCLRHLRALLDGPLHPGLRHDPRKPRGRGADDEPGTLSIMGDGGFSGTTGCSPACRARSSTATTRCC
ncbi:indolepyruvate oxidoreductase subunit IorA [Ditylenchus destructor]|uniref:Indolepyruvate oxidoreductase subunit IorA n=1 Tax=Ditylenchus destructor TaxID=166010 RepID=A0AAD4QWL0_9BILA|nr:indolepyruvate oxidoreductase subunit IorA [Ditylenchus destructor]